MGALAVEAKGQHMAQPVLATQGIALERPVGKAAHAGGKQGAQRLWWRFRQAGGKEDSVSQMHKALSASLGMAIGEVLSQSVAGSTDGALARLQKVGAGLLDNHARTGLLRNYLVKEGPPADLWGCLMDASNRLWVRGAGTCMGTCTLSAAVTACSADTHGRRHAGAGAELRLFRSAEGVRGADRRPAARVPGARPEALLAGSLIPSGQGAPVTLLCCATHAGQGAGHGHLQLRPVAARKLAQRAPRAGGAPER